MPLTSLAFPSVGPALQGRLPVQCSWQERLMPPTKAQRHFPCPQVTPAHSSSHPLGCNHTDISPSPGGFILGGVWAMSVCMGERLSKFKFKNVFNSGLLMLGLGMDGFFFSFSNKLISRSLPQPSLLTQPYLSQCPWAIWPWGSLGLSSLENGSLEREKVPCLVLPSCPGYLGYSLQSRQGVQLPPPPTVMHLTPAMSASPLNNQGDGR